MGRCLIDAYPGQTVIIDSFQSFFIETLQAATDSVYRNGWPPFPNYPVALAHFKCLFRRYRACEVLFYQGYPLDGYSLFRDVKDRAFMLAGVAHNVTTFSKIAGTGETDQDLTEWRKNTTRNRKDEEHRISHWICGGKSGLDKDTIQTLKQWDDLFHGEVHGGQFSLVQEVLALKEGRVNPVGPSLDQDAFVMYMNRSSELGWLILRLLPYLQSRENSFGDEWSRKYHILDDSFRHFVFKLFQALGKEIGRAFVRLVDEKFTFRQPFFYSEADGSASQTSSVLATAPPATI